MRVLRPRDHTFSYPAHAVCDDASLLLLGRNPQREIWDQAREDVCVECLFLHDHDGEGA